MTSGRSKLYKPALIAMGLLMILAVGQFQRGLNRLRADPELALTRRTPLENAPPVLAFTTVALGGFRGLIANVLWIRANDLQQDGRYFEMVQLADWITKLEPHFTQVWLVQAWNMAYNISVKFSDSADRWRWVESGIKLLRDDGIRYNPGEALIYRELAWFFQHKMGQNLDNAHVYYKLTWAREMTAVLGGGFPDFETLLRPPTDEARDRVKRLREIYKMDPEIMQRVDRQYGPLDWRLPETSAIYWAFVGLQNARPKDLVTLRRVIYQSMQTAALRGRLMIVPTSEGETIRLSPNLAIAEQANNAYEQMIREDEPMRAAIQTAHQNFLMEIVFQMYAYNRLEEANRWMQRLRGAYPELLPPDLTLNEFALQRLGASISDLSHDKTKGLIEALVIQSYLSLAIGEEERAAGMMQMAQRVWAFYDSRIQGQQERLGLPSMNEIAQTVRDDLLSPQGIDPVLGARLRTALGLPPPTNAPPASAPGPRP